MPEEETPAVGRYGDRVFAIAVAAAAVWVLWRSWDVGIGVLSRPGPGMWPFAVGIGLLITAVLLIVRTPEGEPFTGKVVRPVALAVLLFAFVGAYEVIGFAIPAILVMLFQLKVLGNESWRTSVIVAVVGALVAFYLFSELLGANMRLI